LNWIGFEFTSNSIIEEKWNANDGKAIENLFVNMVLRKTKLSHRFERT
jgi:hypothetical protein